MGGAEFFSLAPFGHEVAFDLLPVHIGHSSIVNQHLSNIGAHRVRVGVGTAVNIKVCSDGASDRHRAATGLQDTVHIKSHGSCSWSTWVRMDSTK